MIIIQNTKETNMKGIIKDRKIDNRPMTQKLCKRFIEKKIIRTGIKGSGLCINYKNNNEFCRLMKMYEHPKSNDYYFDVDVLGPEVSMRICHTEITMIDGMSPNDLASASDIDVNGKLLAITIMDESNLNETVVGQEYASIEGEELFDGMKIIPMFDVDESLREQTLIVNGVGESISFKKNRGRPRTAYKNKEA